MYRKDVLERISYEMKKNREKDPDGLNYAQIARDMGCDYRTVKAAVARIKSAGPDGQAAKGPSRPPRPSVLDGFRDTVRGKVDGKCKVSAIFRFIKGMGYEGGLTTLKVFCKEYRDGRQAAAQIRFETSPGVQGQVDWKESMTLRDRDGNPHTFNVFLMVLGYSRAKFLELTEDRSRATMERCILDAIEYFGGSPSEVLFDNTKAVVDRASSSFGSATVNQAFAAFCKECLFKPLACVPYRPQTKGKVEDLAKLCENLRAYDGEFSDLSELSGIVRGFCDSLNSEVSQATGERPREALARERPHLSRPDLGAIRRDYLSAPEVRRVGKDSLISFGGRRYSVPPRYIGRQVAVEARGGKLRVAVDGIEVAAHDLPGGMVNYEEGHYVEALLAGPLRGKDEDFVREVAKANLAVYDSIGR